MTQMTDGEKAGRESVGAAGTAGGGGTGGFHGGAAQWTVRARRGKVWADAVLAWRARAS